MLKLSISRASKNAVSEGAFRSGVAPYAEIEQKGWITYRPSERECKASREKSVADGPSPRASAEDRKSK
jgi:hypothetical protein